MLGLQQPRMVRTFLKYTRGLGWRMHCGAEVTESSTNKQHHLSPRTLFCVPACSPFVHRTLLFTMGWNVPNTTLSTILIFTIALIVQ